MRRSNRLTLRLHVAAAAATVVLTTVTVPRFGFAQPATDGTTPDRQTTPLGPLDPMAQAVVDSLMIPERRRPDDLLAAAIRAADVDAVGVATTFLRTLAAAVVDAGDAQASLLADLGERFDDGSLDRMLRRIGSATPADRAVALGLVREMRAAAAARRVDPARIAAAAERLGAADAEDRGAAVAILASAGVDALPVLLPLLDDRDDTGRLARGLVAALGYEGVDVAVGILGSPDVAAWPAALEAIRLLRPDVDRIEPYLLAPALVPDSPPAVRDAAATLLREWTGAVPPRSVAVDRLAKALDRLVAAAPRVASRTAARSFDTASCEDDAEPTLVWDAASGRVVRIPLTTRQRRALEASHLARDLAALGGDDRRNVRAVLLARLEGAATAAGREQPIPAAAALAALAGPQGVDQELVAEVLESAVEKGFFDAAVAAADSLDAAERRTDTDRALLAALRCPDLDVRFAAARAMIRRGRLPFHGASFVMETLLDAATSRGVDRAVVVHPSLRDGQRVAAELAGLGYRSTRVATPRAGLVLARETCDTRLFVVAARSGTPSAMETADLVSRIPADEPIRVVVLVDPSDRGTDRLVANLGPDEALPCVRDPCHCRSGGACPPGPLWWLHEDLDIAPCGPLTIVDDIEGIFEEGVLDGVPPGLPTSRLDESGRASAIAGREARAARRLERCGQALDLLAMLGAEGEDVSRALPLALDAVGEPGLASPAMRLLAVIGREPAQTALHAIVVREGAEATLRQAALEAFRESVDRFGTLLDSHTLLADSRRYNSGSSPEDVRWLREALDTVERSRSRAGP